MKFYGLYIIRPRLLLVGTPIRCVLSDFGCDELDRDPDVFTGRLLRLSNARDQDITLGKIDGTYLLNGIEPMGDEGIAAAIDRFKLDTVTYLGLRARVDDSNDYAQGIVCNRSRANVA